MEITVAGRGSKILRVGGRAADHVLLWAIPDSDLDRIVGVVRSGGDAPLTGRLWWTWATRAASELG